MGINKLKIVMDGFNLNFPLKVVLSLSVLFLLSCSSSPVWVEGKPKHHTSEGFRNYPVVPSSTSPGIRFYLNRIWSALNLPKAPEDHYLSEKKAIHQFQELKGKNTLTWIGHATFLIRIDGKIILTDPFFSKYSGPFSTGPRRFVEPGISVKSLPLIDIIIISHNHYDHLDAETVEALPGKKNIHVFVPLGLKPFFIEKGYIHIHELDWYESSSIDNFQMQALPTVHFSGRGLFDKNKTLWCSWVIHSSSGKYYFAGDTAYSPTIFDKIGKRFHSFDLAMLPIGTYGNRKYGVNNHLNPEEAIKVGMDIKANVFVGMHWGTIELSDEPPLEPPKRFKDAAHQCGIFPERVWIMKIGETRLLPKSQ